MPEGEAMKISELSDAIEKELTLYRDTTTDVMKGAVKKTADEIKADITEHAPVGKSGDYARSWRVKQTEETMSSVTYTIHASKKGYPLAHLLEFGHAKRGGGRTKAIPHIKPAEERGAAALEQKIRRDLT